VGDDERTTEKRRAVLDTAFGATLDAPTLPATSSALLLGLTETTLPIVDSACYELGAVIAEGGIGRIVAARDKRLDRPVAIKELRDERRDSVARFVREAWITARLQHPAIIPIYEAGRWPNGEPFFAMKLVLGRSFAEVLEEPRSVEARLGLLRHVLVASEAVAYAHSRGIVHRDLKPANILVGAFGETVVIDWGLAKDTRAPSLADLGKPRQELTALGAVLGTPIYMPPEQARGEPATERADVYSLGAILYHLLSGTLPYDGAHAGEVLLRVVAGPPAPLAARERGIPEELGAIVEKAMARLPAERFADAGELALALERFEEGRFARLESPPVATAPLPLAPLRQAAPPESVPVLPPPPPQAAAAPARSEWLRVGLVAAVFAALGLVGAAIVRAEGQRALAAEAAAQEAQSMTRRAQDRADAAAVAHARALVGDDPARALAWLKTLSPGTGELAVAREIAEEARKQGILRPLGGPSGPVTALAFAPDGAWLVTGEKDGTLRTWTAEGAPLRALRGAEGPFGGSSSRPAEARCIRRDPRDGVREWSTATGEGRRLPGGGVAGLELALSPSGRRLAVAGDGRITVYDLEKDTSLQPAGQRESFGKLAFSSEGGGARRVG
jgi:serine/threonine protein kinase